MKKPLIKVFLGYYKVFPNLDPGSEFVKKIITRPGLTTVKTGAQGPESTLFTPTAIDTEILEILRNNELSPVTDTDDIMHQGTVAAMINSVYSGLVSDGGNVGSVMIHFLVPSEGPQEGLPTVQFTLKYNNGKEKIYFPPIEIPPVDEGPDVPEPIPPSPPTPESWSIELTAESKLALTVTALPEAGDDAISEFAIQILLENGDGFDSLYGYTVPELGVPVLLDLPVERLTPDTTYVVRLSFGSDEAGYGVGAEEFKTFTTPS